MLSNWLCASSSCNSINSLLSFFSQGFTIASPITVSTGNFQDQVNFDTIIRQEPGAKAMIVQSHEAHAAIVSDDFLSAGALAIGFITVLHALMWLGFTFLLLLIFKSLKYNDIFEKKNITRLRLIALIVGISPLFQLMKNLLFAQVLQKQVSLQKHYISFYYDYSLFSGCLYMILIMVLVEVFRYGMSIKRENDLTV